MCGRAGGGGAGAIGEHPGFGRQQIKMDECGKAKVRGEEENTGTLKKQGWFFLYFSSVKAFKGFCRCDDCSIIWNTEVEHTCTLHSAFG